MLGTPARRPQEREDRAGVDEPAGSCKPDRKSARLAIAAGRRPTHDGTMRRFPIVLMLAALAACGNPAATTAPSASDSPTPSDTPTTESTFTPLPRATHPARPTTPPDSFVAFTDDGDIVVAETATGQIVHKVVGRADLAGPAGALTVQDGRILFYSTKIGDEDCAVWTVPLAGGTPKRIATGAWPSVSPDGRSLAYTRSEGCGVKRTTLTVRDLATGSTRSWTDPDEEFPPGGVFDWRHDSKAVYIQSCGVDQCGPSEVDTTTAGPAMRYIEGPFGEPLDGRDYGYQGTITRGRHLVFTVDYGDYGGDERFPMLEQDPATGRIVAALYDDGREFRPQDFDRSGEHMLILRGDTLNRWSAGNLFPLGEGFVTARWIE